MEINKMKAGRETDALISQVIFSETIPREQWEWSRMNIEDDDSLSFRPTLPRYSSDIAAAFLVVEHLKQKGFGISLDEFSDVAGCSILKPEDGGCWESIAMAKADKLPLAICKAAMMAVSEER